MGMSRCYSLMKCLLILLNIIFLMVGAALCGFAGWALWDGRVTEGGSGRVGLCALLAWGFALLMGALAALAGAARSSAGLLAAAVALIALTALTEGAAAWWGAAHLPQLRIALHDRLLDIMKHDYGLVPSRTQLVDAIQQGLNCCGADSPRDWQSSAWGRLAAETSPPSDSSTGSAALDLSVSAPPAYYWVPPSCCVDESDRQACAGARRVPVAWGGGGAGGMPYAGGLHADGCSTHALDALARLAGAPLVAATALLAGHAIALLLALAMALHAHRLPPYKA